MRCEVLIHHKRWIACAKLVDELLRRHRAMTTTWSRGKRWIAHCDDHSIAQLAIGHVEIEQLDELLGSDEWCICSDVERVSTMIELLATDQQFGSRCSVGVDRIQRASVVARATVRRELF